MRQRVIMIGIINGIIHHLKKYTIGTPARNTIPVKTGADVFILGRLNGGLTVNVILVTTQENSVNILLVIMVCHVGCIKQKGP